MRTYTLPLYQFFVHAHGTCNSCFETSAQKFVYIIDIYPGGPASKANKDANTMEYGDRIEKIGDNKVTGKTSDELEMMLKAIPAEVSSYQHQNVKTRSGRFSEKMS